jgi:hypothetical protein
MVMHIVCLGVKMQSDVSLSVIIKNSEDTIDTFFLWAVDNFDEINVVIDTMNSDSTRPKCFMWANRYTSINIIEREFDNFSMQKQRAIDMTTKPYCLLMDVDEILEELPSNAIAQIMERTGSDVGALSRFNLQRDDEHYNIDSYPDSQYRVIRMGSGIRMNGKVVDETLGMNQETKIIGLPWNIIHYGQIRNLDALKLKGKDRVVFANEDDCDGKGLKEYGDDWFIERNKEWDKACHLNKLSRQTLNQSRKYWK